MKKFLAIYNSPAEAKANMANLTPEQAAASLKPWMDWAQRMGENLVDMGAPVMPAKARDTKGNWTESTSDLGGYSMVQGENLEQVKGYFDNHPHMAYHPACTIEIHELVQM